MKKGLTIIFFLSVISPLFSYPDFLRQGVNATNEEISAAIEMYGQGWRYIMPTPKSPQARWGNNDRRTIWYSGWWHNENTKSYSSITPQKNETGQYSGDGVNESGTLRNGAPRKPDVYMFLLSRNGGPESGPVRQQPYSLMKEGDTW